MDNQIKKKIIIFTLIEFVIFFALGKLYAWSILKKSKVDINLSKKLSAIVKENVTVNIISLKGFINAFCTENRKLYITSAMINTLKLTEDETMAILLHEYRHSKQKMVFLLNDIGQLTATATKYGLILYLLKKVKSNDAAVPIFAWFFLSILCNSIFVFSISRYYERDADGYVKTMGYGNHLASAFKKLQKYLIRTKQEGKSCDRSEMLCRIVVKLKELMSTHPDTDDRIENATNSVLMNNDMNVISSSYKVISPILVKENLKLSIFRFIEMIPNYIRKDFLR